MHTDTRPNHHHDYPAFSGIGGLVAASSMLFGRDADSEFALTLSGVSPGDCLIDIGCGPGATVRAASKRGVTAIGVDPAPVMLKIARLITRRGPTVRWVNGTAESLPLPDRSAQAVTSVASVHHWSDLDASLAEVCRVLAPGGRFVAIERRCRPDASGHASHGWTDEQAESFAAMCRSVGFHDVEVVKHKADKRTVLAVIGRLAA